MHDKSKNALILLLSLVNKCLSIFLSFSLSFFRTVMKEVLLVNLFKIWNLEMLKSSSCVGR